MCEDFIRVYDDAVSEETCSRLIQYYEWYEKNNRVWGREHEDQTGLNKKDFAITLSPRTPNEFLFSHDNIGPYLGEFNDSFWNHAYKHYASEFGVLNNINKHSITGFKIQKTLPGQGYHVWHCEQGSHESAKRIGVYILYLNDVMEGGETEFLYQKVRLEAKQGRLVIFPASYTHTHRGNPPLSNSKYIMTGWVEFV